MQNQKVLMATGYDPNEMGSTGTAAYALIRQHEFPHTYDDTKDVLVSWDHDRAQRADWDHFKACLREFVGTGELAIGSWIRQQYPEKALAFLVKVLKADEQYPGREWTGYRVLGTVNRSNGYPVFTLEVFSKGSDCEVYSGQHAPNVDLSNMKRGGDIYCIYGDDTEFYERKRKRNRSSKA